MKNAKSLNLVTKSLLTCLSAAVLASAPAKADTIRYLPHAKNAVAQYYLDLKSAKKSIDMTYFIFDPCSVVGRIVIDLASQKAKEGVRVRFLIDASNQAAEVRSQFTRMLNSRGIEIRYFNELVFTEEIDPLKQDINTNFRTHAKITLIDGERYITGGRNIADEYFSLGPNLNFVDRDARVEGPSAQVALKYFDELWNSKYSFTPKQSSVADARTYEVGCFGPQTTNDNHIREPKVREFLEQNAEALVANEPLRECADVSYHQDKAEFRETLYTIGKYWPVLDPMKTKARLDMKRTTKTVLEFIRDTKETLFIENWAYIPSWSIEEEMGRIKKDKKKIYVVTNSIGDVGDLTVAILDSRAKDNVGYQRIFPVSQHGSLMDRWEFTPNSPKLEFMLHSKTWMSDKENSFVGSLNIDPRSYHTNVETGVLVKNGPAFADDVFRTFKQLMTVSRADRDCEKCHKVPEIKFEHRYKSWLVREFL